MDKSLFYFHTHHFTNNAWTLEEKSIGAKGHAHSSFGTVASVSCSFHGSGTPYGCTFASPLPVRPSPYGCTSTPPIDVHPYRTSERCETILIGDLYHVFKRLIYLTSVSPSQMTNAIFRIRLSGAFSLLLAIVYPSNNCLILSTEESTYGTASKRP